MPNIPKYSRRKFQSTYVGGPQTDKSGSIIAGAVAEATAPILEQQTKKEEAKIQNIVDQQADSAVVHYSLKYQNTISDLQKQYANDPSKVPQKALEEGAKLANAMGQGIPDERVRARFLSGATAMSKQATLKLATWEVAKHEENALIAAKDVVRTSSLMAGQTLSPEIFFNNVAAVEAKLAEMPELDQEEGRKLLPEMLDSHLYNLVKHDPDLAEEYLNEGMYSDSPYFDSDMKEKFLNKIEMQRRYDKQEVRRAQDDTYSTVIDEIADRELPYSELLARVDSLEGEMRPKDYTRAKTSLFNKIGKETGVLLSSNPKAEKYISAVYKNISSEVGMAEKSAVILDLFDQGLTTEETRQLNQMRRDLDGPSSSEKTAKFLNDMRRYLDMLYANDPVTMANQIRSYLAEVGKGKDPEEAGEEMVQKATRDKVIKDDPSLAISKDPVEDSYINRARARLDADDKSTSDAMIKWMVGKLKAAEGVK